MASVRGVRHEPGARRPWLAAKRQRGRQRTGYRPGSFRGTILSHHDEECERDHRAQPSRRAAVAEGRQEPAYSGARTAADGFCVQVGGVTVMAESSGERNLIWMQ